MKRLNKDSGTMKNTVEAYLCASCSFCDCEHPCPDGGKVEIESGLRSVVGSYASLNVRQF